MPSQIGLSASFETLMKPGNGWEPEAETMWIWTLVPGDRKISCAILHTSQEEGLQSFYRCSEHVRSLEPRTRCSRGSIPARRALGDGNGGLYGRGKTDRRGIFPPSPTAAASDGGPGDCERAQVRLCPDAHARRRREQWTFLTRDRPWQSRLLLHNWVRRPQRLVRGIFVTFAASAKRWAT
jgi:hypothetical protein